RCHRTRKLAAEADERAKAHGSPSVGINDQTIEVVSAGERFKVLKRCQSDEPPTREVRTQHWAACHQIPGFDQSPVTIPELTHKREVVPELLEVDRRILNEAQATASAGGVVAGQEV